jgi:hypothetical protein
MDEACSTKREKGCAYRNMVSKPEGKRSLVTHTRRWQDNIKLYLKEIV